MSDKLDSVNRGALANQTRIGIGATALAALATLATPWWISVPAGLLCAAVAVWGFWPLIRALPFYWRLTLSLGDAARLIYARASPQLREAIRRSSKGDDPNPIETWGRNSLQVCAAASIISLKGRRGLGLPYEAIPSAELEHLWVRDDDTMGGPQGTPPQYIDVIVSRSDALKVLREYEGEILIPRKG